MNIYCPYCGKSATKQSSSNEPQDDCHYFMFIAEELGPDTEFCDYATPYSCGDAIHMFYISEEYYNPNCGECEEGARPRREPYTGL